MRNSAHQQCWALVFLLIYSGQSIPVHFGSFAQPCHWLKRLHLVIRWGKICFLVILQCSQTICFSGWIDATSIAGSLNANLDPFCDGHFSFRMSSIFGVAKLWVYALPMLQVRRRPAKNVISPPKTPPKKQQCKHQECLASIASYKKKLMTCARVRYRRRVDSVAASPREYLVRRAAKNVISPPQSPPKKQQCKHQGCLASYKKKYDVCQGTVQEKSG